MLSVGLGASLALSAVTLDADPVNAAIGNQGQLTVTACVFSNNAAGAIFNDAGKVSVNNCTFSNNQESAITNYTDGGKKAKLTVRTSTFTGNNSGGGYGGAIDNYNSGSKVSVTSSTFSGNTGFVGARSRTRANSPS
jgi:Right handed beta helix region